MAEIINPKNINSIDSAKMAAKNMSDRAIEIEKERREILKQAYSDFMLADASSKEFEEIAALLALPEDAFSLLAPTFLEEMAKSYDNINNQIAMVQAMNLAGVKYEDIKREYFTLCDQIDSDLSNIVSVQKRDFIKQFLGLAYNAILKSEDLQKRTLLVPIELCNENAKIPTYAHATDSGMDVYALEDITIAPGETKLIPTGLKVAIPAGYELQVRPKSGRCLKTKLRIANTPGTIDAGYRDEIGIIVDNIEPFIKSAQMGEGGILYNIEFGSSYTIGKGEKFAQLVLCEVPKAVFYQVEHVSDIANDGRNGGFGSTGVK